MEAIFLMQLISKGLGFIKEFENVISWVHIERTELYLASETIMRKYCYVTIISRSLVVESEGLVGNIGGSIGDERNAGSFMISNFLVEVVFREIDLL